MPGRDDVLPRWMGRGLSLLLMLVLGGGVLLTGLLSLGVADPPLAGPLAWEHRTEADSCLDVRALSLPPLTLPASIVAIAHVNSPPEDLTRWGVWLEAPDSVWRWEVLPPGYFVLGGETHSFFHVHDGSNELRLDLGTPGAVLWLNRERAWESSGAPPAATAWGVIDAQSVCWQRLAIYTPD